MDKMNVHCARQVASITQNQDFLLVQTISDTIIDPHGAHHYLPLDVSERDLGAAVLDALSKSRKLVTPEEEDLLIPENLKAHYDAWKQEVMQQYGYKNRKAMFQHMMNVSIDCEGGEITFMPHHHEKLEAWSSTANYPDDHIIIPASSTPEEIGAALREAFTRCTSVFD